MIVPKAKSKPVKQFYSKAAAQFGSEVAQTCIPTIRPVVDAMPPEDLYSFWCGVFSAFAAMAASTLPVGLPVKVLESTLQGVRDMSAPSPKELN